MKEKIGQKLVLLSKSKFRSKFHLTEKEKIYVEQKGLSEINKHAEDFIKKRLAPILIPNDGKQTPMHGHPVFIAQHATATCCRNCLYKWHQIEKNKPLSKKEQEYVTFLIMEWIQKEMEKTNDCL